MKKYQKGGVIKKVKSKIKSKAKQVGKNVKSKLSNFVDKQRAEQQSTARYKQRKSIGYQSGGPVERPEARPAPTKPGRMTMTRSQSYASRLAAEKARLKAKRAAQYSPEARLAAEKARLKANSEKYQNGGGVIKSSGKPGQRPKLTEEERKKKEAEARKKKRESLGKGAIPTSKRAKKSYELSPEERKKKEAEARRKRANSLGKGVKRTTRPGRDYKMQKGGRVVKGGSLRRSRKH